MNGVDVIKEYLVSLGFKVDASSFGQTKKVMADADKMVAKFASSSKSQFLKAGASVVGFVATANVAIAAFIANLAQADIKNQEFARLMWMSNDAAYAYNNTLKALGATVDELWLSPELMQRFQALRGQAGEMRPPEEYAQQMKTIRDIMFEFQRLKLEGMYALQWIGYYLFKYLEGPLKSIKVSFKDFNDSLTKKMPEWTKNVAQVASWFVRLGIAIYRIKEILGIVVAAFAAFSLVNMGPLGLIVAGLTALLMLIDDYYTYKDGGESAFPKLWKWIDNLVQSMEDNGTIDDFTDSLNELIDSFNELMSSLDDLATDFNFKDLGDALTWLANGALKLLADVLNGIAYSLSLIDTGIKKFKDGIKEMQADPTFKSRWDILTKPWIDLKELWGDKNPNAIWHVPQIIGQAQSSIYPQSSTASGSAPSFSQTNNIYGASQPDQAGKAVERNTYGLLIRGFRGVFG